MDRLLVEEEFRRAAGAVGSLAGMLARGRWSPAAAARAGESLVLAGKNIRLQAGGERAITRGLPHQPAKETKP